MSATAPRRTVREFWVFYRRYVDTPIHALSAALLAIFGILVFVDPLFALLAVASYVLPPIVLYSIGWSARSESADGSRERSSGPIRSTEPQSTGRGATGTDRAERSGRPGSIDADSDSDSDGGDGDTDTDSDDADSDSDSDDGDTDSDSGDGDTDSDSDT